MEYLVDFVQKFGIQIILILLLFFIATLFTLLVYSGLFASIDVKTGKPPIEKVTIAYKDGKGPYSNCGSFFSEACSIAPDKKSIGIYYDDPSVVPAEKLRWAVGSIVSEGDEQVDPELKAAYVKEKYQFMELPAVPVCVTCVFPHTTMISILIGVKRVYPRIMSYVQRQGLKAYPWLEIYYNGEMHFMGPLSEQMSFFTPGALAAGTPQQEDDTETSTGTETKTSSSPDTGTDSETESTSQTPGAEGTPQTPAGTEDTSQTPASADIPASADTAVDTASDDAKSPVAADDDVAESSDDSYEKVEVSDEMPDK